MEISASSDNLRSFVCNVLLNLCQQMEKNSKQGCSNLQNTHGVCEGTHLVRTRRESVHDVTVKGAKLTLIKALAIIKCTRY